MIDIIKALITKANTIHDTAHNIGQYDFLTYLKEFRTISIQAPRRIGKTTAAKQLSSEYSSLVFVHTHRLSENYNNAVSINSIPSIPNVTPIGMRYQCFILDETKPTDGLYEYITRLNSRGLLTKDFFILRLYT